MLRPLLLPRSFQITCCLGGKPIPDVLNKSLISDWTVVELGEYGYVDGHKHLDLQSFGLEHGPCMRYEGRYAFQSFLGWKMEFKLMVLLLNFRAKIYAPIKLSSQIWSRLCVYSKGEEPIPPPALYKKLLLNRTDRKERIALLILIYYHSSVELKKRWHSWVFPW